MMPELFIIGVLIALLLIIAYNWSRLKSEMATRAHNEAREQYEVWRRRDMKRELELATSVIKQKAAQDLAAANREAQVRAAGVRQKADNDLAQAKQELRLAFERWKRDETVRIRQDAAIRSGAVHVGKVTEHLVPWFLDGAFDPRDIRFIGSPIDLMVFDGLSNGYVDAIRFIEVKTGKTPRLSPREELVRGAALAGRVSYSVVHLRQQDDEVGLRPTWTDEDPTKRLQQIMNQELKTLVEKAAEALEMVELEDAAELQTLIFKTFAKNNAQLADQIAVLRKEVESLKDQ